MPPAKLPDSSDHFYTILIVPILLLAFGLYTRISEYGLTEDRYALVICCLWLSGLSVLYVAYRRLAHIKYVPMLLCVLALIAATGPLSASWLSVNSQVHQLRIKLTNVGVLDQKGHVVGKASAGISFEDRKSISSIVDYLSERHAFRYIAAWTRPFQAEIDKGSPAGPPCSTRLYYRCTDVDNMNKGRKILEAWGVGYVSKWETSEHLHQDFFNVFYDNRNDMAKISPYEYMLRVNPFTSQQDWTETETYKEAGKEIQKVTMSMTAKGDFTLRLADGRKTVFPLQSLADELYKQKITNVPEDKSDMLTLHKTEDGIDAMLQISNMRGRIVGGNVNLEGAGIMVLFTPKPVKK